ncbi:MAG: OmpA family protein [Rhodobacteraceae bacterium]|nr:OmpA family protein [Paracoccaceae bacterium]
MRMILIGAGLLALAGCVGEGEVGSSMSQSGFGQATATNIGIETGQLSYAVDLSRRFASEVPNTVNFEFDSATLDEGARVTLRKQADWIRQFPEVRFRVFGYTDEVGSEAYNKGLGMRRAQAVVAFLSTQGISRARLEAVVSYGKTQPLIDVPTPERRNRRALTDVSGFVKGSPLVLDGKYADIIYRSYVESAAPKKDSGGSSGSSGSGGSGSSTGPAPIVK